MTSLSNLDSQRIADMPSCLDVNRVNFRRFVDENSFVREIELSHYGKATINPELIEMIKKVHGKKGEDYLRERLE